MNLNNNKKKIQHHKNSSEIISMPNKINNSLINNVLIKKDIKAKLISPNLQSIFANDEKRNQAIKYVQKLRERKIKTKTSENSLNSLNKDNSMNNIFNNTFNNNNNFMNNLNNNNIQNDQQFYNNNYYENNNYNNNNNNYYENNNNNNNYYDNNNYNNNNYYDNNNNYNNYNNYNYEPEKKILKNKNYSIPKPIVSKPIVSYTSKNTYNINKNNKLKSNHYKSSSISKDINFNDNNNIFNDEDQMAFYGQTQRESPNNKIIGGTINFNNNISKTNRKYSNNYNFNNKTPVYMNIELKIIIIISKVFIH